MIGVDIGTTHIRAAEVEITSKPGQAPSGVLHNFAAVPTPVGATADGDVLQVETVASVLKQIFAKGGFSHKQVVIGVGSQRTVVREMDVDAFPMEQLRSSLPFQVAEVLPMSTDEALLDFYPTQFREQDGSGLLRGIMVAVPKPGVANTVMAVESAGLRPINVDLNAFALHRAMLAGDWNENVVALVDVGAKLTTVVVAAQGEPRLVRILPTGGHDATEAIVTTSQLPLAEAEQLKRAVGIASNIPPEHASARDAVLGVARQMVDGIRNTFVYYSSNNPGLPIQHVILTGGGAILNGFGQYLASATRLPVAFGNGLAHVKVNKKLQASMQGQEIFAGTAVGLALAEVKA